jgi:hypothetical protein
VILDIRSALRRRTHAEFHRREAVPLEQRARRLVILMRMQFEPRRRTVLGELEQPAAPAATLFVRIDIQPVDI